jgi:adenosine deaminase
VIVPEADTTLPKAELHVHLEGTAPPALIRRLAERNGMTVPEGVFKSDDEFEWSDFLHFLRTYDLAASVIRTPEDYRDVTFEYLVSCAAEGAVYVEVIASPDHAAAVGLSDAEHYAGIAQGIDDARHEHGIEARIVIAAVRNLGVEAAEAIVRRHADDRHPYVVGFNLVGDEAAWPAGLFARAYDIAAASGLGCTVHAGEHDGTDSIRAALALPITRMSHGVRAVEDPALVAEIAERELVLEVCPSSNVALRLYQSYDDHPLGALREAGVRITLGSDDPPYFGCSIGAEYAVARQYHGFEEEQLVEVTRLAVEAGFAEDAVKEGLRARLDFPGDRRTD